jgi:hypothetical protein
MTSWNLKVYYRGHNSLLVVNFQIHMALMMEAARTSETSVDILLRSRQYMPQDSELHTRRRVNLKSPTWIQFTTLCPIFPLILFFNTSINPHWNFNGQCWRLRMYRKDTHFSLSTWLTVVVGGWMTWPSDAAQTYCATFRVNWLYRPSTRSSIQRPE